MGSGKNLTIGITVNLEHYENLRLEVSGEVEREGDATELVRFLDEVLGRLGQDDPATKDRVDSYRRRVLASGLRPGKPDTAVMGQQDGIKEYNVSAPSVPAVAESPGGTASARDSKQPSSPDITGTGEREESTPPVAASAGSGETICESCGVAITAAERKMSQLFTGKDLCKSCMKKT
jgi:hypothetical protein